jgi:hypothetical protein
MRYERFKTLLEDMLLKSKEDEQEDLENEFSTHHGRGFNKGRVNAITNILEKYKECCL